MKMAALEQWLAKTLDNYIHGCLYVFVGMHVYLYVLVLPYTPFCTFYLVSVEPLCISCDLNIYEIKCSLSC